MDQTKHNNGHSGHHEHSGGVRPETKTYRPAAPSLPPMDVTKIFQGKNLLLVGCTGFVGKVALAMLLHRYPGIGKIFTVVRPGMGDTPDARFFGRIVKAAVFDPVRERFGPGFDEYIREKVVPIAGDVGRPLCNLTEADFAAFQKAGGLHAVINSAGLVTFTPSLESALRINVFGASHGVDVARKTGAGLVHISTCFVAGRRDGEVWEDDPVIGYFPRHEELRGTHFDANAETADCKRVIEEVNRQADDRRHLAEFRERAIVAMKKQGRDPDDESSLKLAAMRERKLWVHEELTRVGVERANYWGWTNTYTYTKSLGEQMVLSASDIKSCVVRPAIVESSMGFPFPGWNEGFNTTAPLVYLMLKGHRQVVVGENTPLDVIPVDMVASGMIMATAAVIAGTHKPVYQLGSSDSNPVTSRRLVELSALVIRRYRKSQADEGITPFENRLRARFEAVPVSAKRFEKASAPQLRKMASWASKTIEKNVPRWGAPRVMAMAERVQEGLARVEDFSTRVTDLMELFQPFTHDCHLTFRADNTRAMYNAMPAHDQQLLNWRPEGIDWRAYWFDIHFVGLLKWVFPVLDDEFEAKPRSVYSYKDLLELFDSAAKLHKDRVALRLLPTDDDAATTVYTYKRLRQLAESVGQKLQGSGVAAGDRVMLMAENRPEWGICYFGVLKAGGVVVPLDSQLSWQEVVTLAQAAGSRVLVISPKVAERLCDKTKSPDIGLGFATELEQRFAEAGLADLRVFLLEALMAETRGGNPLVLPPKKGDVLASIIYTSGTTGSPKGVMLSHKNFTSMVAKMSSLFRLYKHDSLLSVLPLHHTFEFAAGFLMPLTHGAQIHYMEEIEPTALSKALGQGTITGMIGVPALWQAMHRKIWQPIADAGPLAARGVSTIIDQSRRVAEKTPLGDTFGRVLFWPVHRKMGGRLRLLISGGSALSPDLMKQMRGLGFKLFEGYGMTEASPVIATQRPGSKQIAGSVGKPLPGVDIKIDTPDENGVGEVLARGPNIMAGYYQNADATSAVLKDGWLYTGDLGKLDASGNLYIVGRRKEMILSASGENVYPDELEELYKDQKLIKELSVVGLPRGEKGELVAALVVPDYAASDLSREELREAVREHLQKTGAKLPTHKRLSVVHLWDHDLPKTSTRKVKRREVAAELERLEDARKAATSSLSKAQTKKGPTAQPDAAFDKSDTAWLIDVLAQVSQKPKTAMVPSAKLSDLGFDSLMYAELGVALEAAGVTLPTAAQLHTIETIKDLAAYTTAHRSRSQVSKKLPKPPVKAESEEIKVPAPLVKLGRSVLRFGQQSLYDKYLDARVTGSAYIPPTGGFIVAANHSSHLDMGLVKHSLGDLSERLVALAAKDYFFEDPVRRMYFQNFTNLIPMERQGSLRESLKLAGEILQEGYVLLIFPEGTRSETGVMIDFKPSLGYLALTNRCGILPMYLGGTHRAMPKGALLPKRQRVDAAIAPFQTYEAMSASVQGMARSAGYRKIAGQVEKLVRSVAPKSYEWTLGPTGRENAIAQEEGSKPPSAAREVGR